MTWKPYCYESKCIKIHKKQIIAHGSCCTCEFCGHLYDNCICQYFEEPCLSCVFRN